MHLKLALKPKPSQVFRHFFCGTKLLESAHWSCGRRLRFYFSLKTKTYEVRRDKRLYFIKEGMKFISKKKTAKNDFHKNL